MDQPTLVTAAGGAAAGLVLAVVVMRWVAGRAYRRPEERAYPEPPQSWAYPVSTLVGAGLVWRFADRPATLMVLLALWVPLLALAAIDQDTHRLPERITLPLYPALAVALLVPALAEGAWPDYLRALLAGAVAYLAYYLLHRVRRSGFGRGDVTLGGILGMALGWVSWLTLAYGLLAGIFLAAVVGLSLVAAGRLSRKDYVPLGPFLVVGAVATLMVAP